MIKVKYLVLLLPSLAYATGAPEPVAPSAQSESVAQAVSSASATSVASSGGNSLSVSAPRQAPSVAIGGVFPSAQCHGGVSIGGSGTGGAGALGFSFSRRECETVLLAQNFAALGQTEIACELLITTAAFKRSKLLPPDCRPKPPAPPAAPVSVTVEHKSCDDAAYVRKDDMQSALDAERAKRVFKACVSK